MTRNTFFLVYSTETEDVEEASKKLRAKAKELEKCSELKLETVSALRL